MSIAAVLAPVFVQVLLTIILLFWSGRVRYAAVAGGEVHPRDIALREPKWPRRATQVANSYQNQLELPLLFYVLTVLAIITRKADLLFVILAWVFVVSRIFHAAIHVTSNHLGRRFGAFVAGVVVLAVMWVVFAIRVLFGS